MRDFDLSESQIAAFREAGYVAVRRPVLPSAQFHKLKTYWDERIDRLGVQLPLWMQPHFSDPAIFEWVFADAVLDLVEPLIGPDICFFCSHLLCKIPRATMPPRWHKDCFYWRGMMVPSKFCVVAISLEPSRQENGCLLAVPGSHLLPHRDDAPAPPVQDDKTLSQFCEPRAVSVELEANEASLHHGCLLHGGGPNLTSAPRRSFFLFYISAQARFHAELSELFPPYLIRGRGLSENRYADPARAYPDTARRIEALTREPSGSEPPRWMVRAEPYLRRVRS